MIVDTEGNTLREHDGAWNYTIGQRKGLNIKQPAADGQPRYVTDINAQTGTVTVGSRRDLSVGVIEADRLKYLHPIDSLYVPHLTPQQLALLKEGNTPLRELFPSQDDKQKNKEIDTTGFEQLSYSFSGHNPFWRHNGQIYHLIYKEWYDYEQNDWKSERQYVVVKGYDNASLKEVPNGFLADKNE